MNAEHSLMNRFLAAVRDGRVLASVQLSGGQAVSGTILSFDGSGLLLAVGGRQMFVPSAAVVSVTPARPLPEMECGV